MKYQSKYQTQYTELRAKFKKLPSWFELTTEEAKQNNEFFIKISSRLIFGNKKESYYEDEIDYMKFNPPHRPWHGR